jgi:hypothetical protein
MDIGVYGVTCLSVLEQLSRSNVERWSSLEDIPSDIPSDIHSIPSGLFQGRFLSLCELTITESRSALFWAQEILPDAPALETVSLTLDGTESQLLSIFSSYPAWSRVRRLRISVEGEEQISTKEIIQKCPKLEELRLSPADLTGIEVTPASSQFLCKLSLEATDLPSIPPVLATLPALSCLALDCRSSYEPTPQESITLPALRELSMTGRFHFLPCILAPNLYSLRLEEGPYFLSPEPFIKAAWDTTRARTHMLQPSHLTIKDVVIQTNVLLMVLQQNPQLTTFNYHGGFPRASFFNHLANTSEKIAPRLEAIYMRETVWMTPWQAIRSPVLAVVRARHGPGKTLKSLYCISDSGGKRLATGREFCT